MTQHGFADVHSLLEQASRRRLLSYQRITGETVTLQIGRVVYAVKKDRVAGLLQQALASASRQDRRFSEAPCPAGS